MMKLFIVETYSKYTVCKSITSKFDHYVSYTDQPNYFYADVMIYAYASNGKANVGGQPKLPSYPSVVGPNLFPAKCGL